MRSAQTTVCTQTTVHAAAGHTSPSLTSSPPSPLLLMHPHVCCEDLDLFSCYAAAPRSWAECSPCSSIVLAVSWQTQNQAHSIKAPMAAAHPGLVRPMLHQPSHCHRGFYCAGAVRAQLHPGSMCRKPLQKCLVQHSLHLIRKFWYICLVADL